MSNLEAKIALRRTMLERRAALDPETRLRASEQATLHALPLFQNSKDAVALYWPVRNEISPLILAEHLVERGHDLCLPVVINPNAALAFRAWSPGDPLHKGRYGIDEPSQKASFVTPSVLIVPLLAFDKNGTRLGTGGGYYDRTLCELRQAGGVKAYGLAYAFQQVDNLPTDPHDECLDVIITEKGIVLP